MLTIFNPLYFLQIWWNLVVNAALMQIVTLQSKIFHVSTMEFLPRMTLCLSVDVTTSMLLKTSNVYQV